MGWCWPLFCISFPSKSSKLHAQRRAEVPMVSDGEQVQANAAPSSHSFIHLSLIQDLSRAYHAPGWTQVLRRWQLARGPTPRLGQHHPLSYRRPDRMLPRVNMQEELVTQRNEKGEPNDLWVGRDCQDYLLTCSFSDYQCCFYTQGNGTDWLMMESVNTELFF